tara:strand:+ start:188 stop:709 length:522 start_codon:yes stop_codon:yes gene_type:complete
MNLRSFAAGALLVLATGCSSQDEKDMNLADLDTTIVDNGTSPGGNASDQSNGVEQTPDRPVAAPADMGNSIPSIIRGRWGMAPADCTSTHGDAKGLLEISGTTLNFYESRGTLGAIKEFEPTRIRAMFAFEGEGMNWIRDMTLDVQDDGQTLIRREYGLDAAPGPIRYRRCTE